MTIDAGDYVVDRVAPLLPGGKRKGRSTSDQEAAVPVDARRQMRIEWFNDAATTALSDPNTPLVDGLLDEGALSVIYGDSNAGKTFVSLNTAFHVAAGLPWNGREVQHGLVVYVAAEGGKKIKRRIAALRRAYIEDQGENAAAPLFALIRFPVDLRSSDADIAQLLALIGQAERTAKAPCVWVVVDTLSRAMAGGDENSPVDMGRIVAAADRIRAETHAHFTFVHHTGKDAARGARGHSLLRAATDTEIEVTPDGIAVTKQRDMEGGFTLGFRLVDIEIGADPDGNAIRSAVVAWHGAPAASERKERSVPQSSRLLMDIIRGAIADAGKTIRPFSNGPAVRAVDDETVRGIYYERIAEKAAADEDAKALSNRQRQGFYRSIKGVIDRKLIVAALQNDIRWLWLP